MKQNYLSVVTIVLVTIFTFSSCDESELLFDENRPTQVFYQGEALTDSTTASSVNKSVPGVVVNIWGRLDSKADSTIRVTIEDVAVSNGNNSISLEINESLMEPTGTETSSNIEGLSSSKVQLCEPILFPQPLTFISVTVSYVVRAFDSQLPLGRVVLKDHLTRDLHYSSPFLGGSIDVELVVQLKEIKFFATVDSYVD